MTETIDKGKIFLAFILATTLALLCAASIECAAVGLKLASGDSCGGTVARYLLGGSFIAYPIAVVVGIPLYLAFQRFRWLMCWQVAAGCAFLGLVAALVVHLLSPLPLTAVAYIAFAVLGAAIGVLFWAIGVRRLEP